MTTTFRDEGDAIIAECSAGTYLHTRNGHGDALALYRIERSGG